MLFRGKSCRRAQLWNTTSSRDISFALRGSWPPISREIKVLCLLLVSQNLFGLVLFVYGKVLIVKKTCLRIFRHFFWCCFRLWNANIINLQNAYLFCKIEGRYVLFKNCDRCMDSVSRHLFLNALYVSQLGKNSERAIKDFVLLLQACVVKACNANYLRRRI